MYTPLTSEAVITRKEFDLMKNRFDEQVEALKGKCEKKENSFDDGEMGESPFTTDILKAPISLKFKTLASVEHSRLLSQEVLGSGIEGCQKTATHLTTIRQKEGETLREYVIHFEEEHLKVAHCSDDSAICYFLTGMADETLIVKLGKEAPSTFAEVLQKAKTVIDGQELLSTKLGRTDKRFDQKRSGNQEKGKSDSKYSTTTIPISEILTNIKENGLEKLLKQPDKLKGDPKKRNKDRYYSFHRDHGNDTSSYWELKRQIENLILDGYFKKYVDKPGLSSTEKKEERKRSRMPPRRDDRPAVINTIFGGPSGGKFENKRKKLAKKAWREVCTIQEQRPTCPISFSDYDLEGVYLPQNDALVISPLIDHVQVRRVLVNGGASANILSVTTYLALLLKVASTFASPSAKVTLKSRRWSSLW
ncbi:uncharacterized protein LOC111006997 [Momordica charantia]|uniref:Uncharacterized protein LOC111006997 n=1 Tax=Momordica charantia TaxID=3673 RepID=A0A6J1BZE1_MOMCH|nr:uncharacterized protein LOC111006997 [Momordica charantia]